MSKKLLGAVFFCFITITTYAEYHSPVQIAAGHLIDYYEQALIARQDSNLDWGFTPIMNLPNSDISRIEGIDCNKTSCVAVGYFGPPGVLVSHDLGVTWNFLPLDVTNPTKQSLSNVSCNDERCIMGGFNGESSTYSLLSLSNGLSRWETINVSIPDYFRHGRILQIDCGQKNCVAVGNYDDTQLRKIVPLVFFSNDWGANWTFIDKIQDFPYNSLPSDNNNAVETGAVSCSGSICLIGGTYEAPENINRRLLWLANPILIASFDDGKNWKYIPVANHEKDTMHVGINDVSCANNICSGVGSFYMDKSIDKDNNVNEQPFIVTLGKYNQAGFKFTSFQNQPNFDSGILFSTDCENNVCRAVGHYSMNGENRPLIYISRDYGVTWFYDANIRNLPNNIKSYYLNRVNCTGFICAAVGCYAENQDQAGQEFIRPFLIDSTDGGLSWKVSNNIMNGMDKKYAGTLLYTNNQTGPQNGYYPAVCYYKG